MPLGGNKICLVKVCSEVSPERVECTDERSESGREFQIVGAAMRKEREPKIGLLRKTFNRLEEEDDLYTKGNCYLHIKVSSYLNH